MSSQRVGYTINPETGKQIKIGGPTWKRLAAKYYMVGNTFTDQPITTREPMCRTRYLE